MPNGMMQNFQPETTASYQPMTIGGIETVEQSNAQ